MQEGRPIPFRQINRELLGSILNSPKWFWIAVVVLGLIVLGAMSAAGAFVGLFVLWVVLPRKLLRNKSKTPRTPRPVRRRGAPAPAPQTSE